MKKGILIAFLIVIVLVATISIIGGLFYLQFNKKPNIPPATYLKIHLKGSITDLDTNVFSNKELTMKKLFYHIMRAKIDARVKGIILKLSPLSTSIDKAQEIGQLLSEFRKSNKKVYAFIENGGLTELLIASYADRVYSLKYNFISMSGLSIQAVFVKDTLSKIGIEPDFLQIAEYKTGPNMFTKSGFTKAHKESYQLLIDDIYKASLQTIASNRNIRISDLKKIINSFPLTNDVYLQNKLIDGEIYEDELAEKENLHLPLTLFKNYQATTSPSPFKGPDKIAIVFANGEIHEGISSGTSITGNKIIGSDSIVKLLRRCRKDSSVKAVILRVDSPGGSPVASDLIRREAELIMSKKPMIVSMSGVAASGGYFISMSSSKIFAFPQTITGSIGIYGGKFVLKGLYDKIGLKKEILSTSNYAGMFGDYKKFSEQERNKYFQIMKNFYNSFITKVSKFRKIDLLKMDQIARGRVWAGESAIANNLIDEFGGLLQAVNCGKKLAGIPESQPVSLLTLPKKVSLFEFLTDSISGSRISEKLSLNLLQKIKKYQNLFPAFLLPLQIVIN
jgi:protease-4